MLREPVATCLEVALATGLRIGDIVELTPEQVKGDIIEYTARKTGKSGIAKLPPELADRLHNPWFAAGAWVFKSPRGGDKHISRGTVWAQLKKAAKRLNLRENVAPHSARKTYAVDLFKRSDLEETRRQLQHDRVSTTMLYAFADKLAAERSGNKAEKHNDDDLKEFARTVAREVVAMLRAQKLTKF